MHELSIALSLIDMATEEADRHGSRVTAIHVKLGRLSGVATEALVAAYEMAAEGTPLEGTRLVIDEVPPVVRCAVCREDRPTRQHEWYACEVCGTPATDFVCGRELELAALELE
jgi:hydrogenase nickel incorporation protein HypA/HybF